MYNVYLSVLLITHNPSQAIACFQPTPPTPKQRFPDVFGNIERDHTYVCVLGVRNVSFSENFAFLLND